MLIDRQLARLQRAHGFTALTLVQHQSPLHGAGFGVNGGDGAVNGIAKPQRTGGMVDSGAERLQIVVNNLRHVEGGGVKTIHNPALVQRTTLRSGNPQRVLLLAVGHFVGPFSDGLAQHLFRGVGAKAASQQQRSE